MADISAKQVVALRERTGVGMMKCKEALVKTNGDIEKAVLLLREQGLAAAAKKASRIAAEGVIAIYNKNNIAVLVEVNAETDFVAKNEKFTTFANRIAEIVAINNPSDIEALNEMEYETGKTVEDMRKEMVLVIGENISVRRFERLEGAVATYNHGNGKIGVMALFNTELSVASTEKFQLFGKDVCMQVAALNPQYLSKEAVPADVIETEKTVLMAQIKNDPKTANKPEAVIEKMISGKLNKFYSENCLLEQAYFKDESMTVAKYIASAEKEFGVDISLEKVVRFERGEGIQKREDNFAEEVANLTK